jgi:hypothetical protein
MGTSLASQSLYAAQQKGVAVNKEIMAKVDDYTQKTASPAAGSGSGVGAGVGSGSAPGFAGAGAYPPSATMSVEVTASSAGVSLYKKAQELEQMSRSAADRKKNAVAINGIKAQLGDARFVTGFGSIGGEEFFSWLNIGESLHRAGGAEFERWNTDTKTKILKMQNEDGTWAGHHCITGRVAVTSAAVLNLLQDREPVISAATSANGGNSGRK